MAQLVEHILGKDEVTGSTPVSSSSEGAKVTLLHFFCKKISLDALLLRFSQKVTQAELFAMRSLSLAYYRTVPFNFVLTVIEICDARFHLAIPSLRSLQLRLAAPQAVKHRLFY